jgi:hypothetical protein
MQRFYNSSFVSPYQKIYTELVKKDIEIRTLLITSSQWQRSEDTIFLATVKLVTEEEPAV